LPGARLALQPRLDRRDEARAKFKRVDVERFDLRLASGPRT